MASALARFSRRRRRRKTARNCRKQERSRRLGRSLPSNFRTHIQVALKTAGGLASLIFLAMVLSACADRTGGVAPTAEPAPVTAPGNTPDATPTAVAAGPTPQPTADVPATVIAILTRVAPTGHLRPRSHARRPGPSWQPPSPRLRYAPSRSSRSAHGRWRCDADCANVNAASAPDPGRTLNIGHREEH